MAFEPKNSFPAIVIPELEDPALGTAQYASRIRQSRDVFNFVLAHSLPMITITIICERIVCHLPFGLPVLKHSSLEQKQNCYSTQVHPTL